MKKTKKIKWQKPILKKLSYKDILEETATGQCIPGSSGSGDCLSGSVPSSLLCSTGGSPSY